MAKPRRRRRATVPVSPSARTRLPRSAIALEAVLTLLAVGAILLGFTITSSLAGELSDRRGWMLLVGLLLSVAAPLALVFWVRRYVRHHWRVWGIRGTLLWVNVLVCLLLLVTAGGSMRRTLLARGNWWVVAASHAFGGTGHNGLTELSEGALSWLARRLPEPPPRWAGPPIQPAEAQLTIVERDAAAAPSTVDLGLAALETSPVLRAMVERQLDASVDAASAGIPFERHGGTIIVPVTLHGPELHTEVKMLFDTGASLSTIDSATLGQLGLYVTGSDPTVMVHTANGKTQRTISVVEGISVGNARVSGGLAVALCDACVNGEIRGLLGLNFARHFRVTVDQEAGELLLEPKGSPPSQLYDIQSFVALQEAKGVQSGSMFRVTVRMHNNSPRALYDVVVRAEVVDGPETDLHTTVDQVPPRSNVTIRFGGLATAPITQFRVKLDQARW